ncbi:MAG TPA: O-antigen ligase family protein, partial [Alphaproteobacteria bacterium]|nr:O-antigen ligase family protein [Alphaproteobacteria bacterium]
MLWIFVAGLAWVPFWYGSNDWLAWGVNAVIFPGLAALYELSLLVRGKRHPVAIGNLAFPAALFTGVVLWIGVQCLTWPHSPLANSIWSMAGSALGHPIAASITVNRDLTVVALIRLITAASVFWLALQLCRNSKRANLLFGAIGAIGAGYAAYGIVAVRFGQLPWLHYIDPKTHNLSSTFIDPDSFATYAAIGLTVLAGLILRFYGDAMSAAAGNWRLQIAFFIERTGSRGAALLAGGFLVLAALLFTGSRGGLMAAALGLFVLGVLARRRRGQAKVPFLLLFIGFVLVASMLFAFGNAIGVKLEAGGVYDANRFSVYLLTLRSILNKPLLGYGYGTFIDVFPMYRDQSLGVTGIWAQAHDTYLEIFQGLGLVFGTMLIACVGILVMRCLKGAMRRQKGIIAPSIAASAAFVVAAHALVDFSLQIQAVAITLMAVLGAGLAQSES